MNCDNGIDLPTAEELAFQVALVSKERQVPQSCCIKGVPHIEIGWAAFLLLVKGEALVRASAWPLERSVINALAPAVVDTELNATIKTASQVSYQSIVVCVGIRARKKYVP